MGEIAATAMAALKAEQRRALETFHIRKRCFHFAPAALSELTTASWRVSCHFVARNNQPTGEDVINPLSI